MNWSESWEDYAGSFVGTADVHDRPANPRGGILWQANQNVSLYGSYSSNYGSSALGQNAPGQKFLPPENGDQVEFGAKSEWHGARFVPAFLLDLPLHHSKDKSRTRFFALLCRSQRKAL